MFAEKTDSESSCLLFEKEKLSDHICVWRFLVSVSPSGEAKTRKYFLQVRMTKRYLFVEAFFIKQTDKQLIDPL